VWYASVLIYQGVIIALKKREKIKNMSLSMAGATAIGAGVQGIGIATGMGQGRKQYHRNKKLMRFQKQHQMDLNQHGHDLQMDMWNKTNYKAQLEHMKAAGLNPALMYGMSGGGGTTAGSQGGGSAQGGSVDQARAMDMSNILAGKQAEMMAAQIAKTKAETREIEGETKFGAAKVLDLLAGIDKTKADTRLVKANETGQKILNEINEASSDAQIRQYTAQLGYTLQQAENVRLENYILNESKEANIRKAKEEAVGQAIENMLKRANISKTEEETRAIGVKLSQEWVRLGQKDKELRISKFKEEVKAEFPTLWQAGGKMVNDLLDTTETIMKNLFGSEDIGYRHDGDYERRNKSRKIKLD
jgi:hypothetical protein